MTSKDKHQKHPKLKRSDIGSYHRCEWAIYGTNCDGISELFDQISTQLNQYNFLYVDADHNEIEKDTHNHIGKKQFSSNRVQSWNEFDDRLNHLQTDAAFVNGNHYSANKQIVIIDPKKEESLKRRLDQLDDISMVIVNNSEEEIYDFIKDKITDKTIIVESSNIAEISEYLAIQIEKSKPELKAIILAGGKSQRMGFDKSQIEYHNGLTQENHLNDLLSKRNINTYISKRYNYVSKDNSKLIINDRLVDMGPFGAIISAMMTDPNAAWLVIACDLPFLDEALIDRLIDARNTGKFATAYRGAKNPFPEPLITIYEPRSYQRFLSFLSLGYACPRKVLINSDIEEIVLHDMNAITNANTPEEMELAKTKLENG